MNPLTKAAALAALLAAALAACSGGGKNVPASSAGAIAAVAPQRGSSDVAYGADLLTDAQYLGPATLDSLGVDVFVTMRDAAGLVNYAAQVSDPLSPLYRQWLRPEELGDRFGAIKDDYDATAAALRSFGIATKTYPQRQMIRARGPQPALERALGTTFAYYRKGDVVFVAPATAPHPSAAVHIAALGALAGYSANQRAFVPVRAGNALVQGLTPRQIANVFDFTGAWNAGYTGRGINVGIIATGPITDGDPRIAIGDVADFKVLYGLGGSGAIRQVFGTDANVSPGNGSPGGSYSTGLATPPPVTNINCKGTLPACNPEDIEAQLDTEQASTLAPDANVLFYIAYNPNECNSRTPCGTGGAPAAAPAIGINETDDEIQQAIGDNQADVISMSFGIGEPQGKGFNFNANGVGFGPTEFASLVAEGIAVFASSGDTGAQGCGTAQICVGYPSGDPSVVSVGGTNTPLDTSGRLSGVLTGWTGSGGGCSTIFAQPAFQAGVTPFGTSCSRRMQPDVALDADTSTGVAVDYDASPGLGGRQVVAVGGTSVSSPQMAAMWALVLQACKQTAGCATGGGPFPYRLGNPNPLLYAIYGGKKPLSYAQVFYDVGFGNNAQTGGTGYTAGPGYDLVTGIGAPFGRNLIKAVVGV